MAHASISLPSWWGDHMVLQRDRPLHISGQAQPDEPIELHWDTDVFRTTTKLDGHWSFALPAQSAGGPHRITLKGLHDTVTVTDVLVGDVWLASGQSNMEWSLAQSLRGDEEAAGANWPTLRHWKVPHAIAFAPKTSLVQSASWTVSSPNTAGDFSAVGYYFARRLQRDLNVPIGIVNVSWGGSQIEGWISAPALEKRTGIRAGDLAQDAEQLRQRYQQRMQVMVRAWQGDTGLAGSSSAQWQSSELDDTAWSTLQVPRIWEEQGLPDLDGVVWYRRAVYLDTQQAASPATLSLGMIDDCDETWVNGKLVGSQCVWDSQRNYTIPAGLLQAGRNVIAVRVTDTGGGGGFHGEANAVQLHTTRGKVALHGSWKARVERISGKTEIGPNDAPSVLFNAMINPLTTMPVRGVLWYQGESNVPRAQQYAELLPAIIRDWRSLWNDPNLPFYYVQLASFLPLKNNTLQGSTWAELREAQRLTLTATPHTGMVVATDVGDADSIHPLRKQPVGERLALLALRDSYGRAPIVASGPLYHSMRLQGTVVELTFTDLGGGLGIRYGDRALRGFSIAGADRRFIAANASIRGDKVLVSHPAIPHPQAVRYGWVDNPEESNLVNREGLPASPFRTDEWPLLTAGQRYQP